MLEKLAERFHTTPQTIVALNGPDKLIGPGQALRLPNVLPRSRDYAKAIDDKQGGCSTSSMSMRSSRRVTSSWSTSPTA